MTLQYCPASPKHKSCLNSFFGVFSIRGLLAQDTVGVSIITNVEHPRRLGVSSQAIPILASVNWPDKDELLQRKSTRQVPPPVAEANRENGANPLRGRRCN